MSRNCSAGTINARNPVPPLDLPRQPGGGRRRCRERQRGFRPTRHRDRPTQTRSANSPSPRLEQRRTRGDGSHAVGDGLMPTVGQRHGHGLGPQRVRDGEPATSPGRRRPARGAGPHGPPIPRPAPRRPRARHPHLDDEQFRPRPGHQSPGSEEPVERCPGRGGRWKLGDIAELDCGFRYHRRGFECGEVGQEGRITPGWCRP